MWHELQLFLIALHGGTRLPLPAWAGGRPEWAARSARHDPAVGLVVGAFAAVVLFVAAHAWPASLSVLLALAATVWFTRAAGETGLVRCCDAWARRDAPAPAMRLAAPLGFAGVLGLLFTLALRGLALHGLATRDLALTLAAMPLAQAWSAAVVMIGLHLRRDGGATSASAPPETAGAAVDGLDFAAALMWSAVATAGAGMSVPGLALAEAALWLIGVAIGLHWLLRRRFGRLDADALALVRQGCESAVYLGLLSALVRG